MTENDLTALRDRYLGVTNKKRKIRKMNDRKFVFDWAEEEDTFASDSPIALGANRQGAQVMFGRGRVGGMDDGGVAYSGTGAEANLADSMERRKAAKSGIDERHWSDKPLPEMKERDWRIFREDFSIAARGEHLLRNMQFLCLRSFLCRWFYSPPIAFLGGVYDPTIYTQRYRKDWLQGTLAHSTTSYPNRFAEPGHHWYRRDGCVKFFKFARQPC
jgi:hypothetical protein